MSIYKGSKKIKDVCIAGQNTNCIVNIPQNIKLSLSNGVLTLKAGSKIYIPNGKTSKKYYKYVTQAWSQPTSPSGITATSGWANIANAFDKNSSTYATCGTATDYIEWNIGAEIYLSGVTITGQWADSVARACNIIVKSVNTVGTETTLCTTTGAKASSTYTTSASFSKVLVKKLRFYLTAGPNGNPTTTYKTRIREITLTSTEKRVAVESTADNYDYIVPAGQTIFDEIILDKDISSSGSAVTDTSTRMLYYKYPSGLYLYVNHSSGTTKPTTGTNQIFYNIQDNTVREYDSGVDQNVSFSLPIARVTANGSNTVGSIAQIFNGFSYMGASIFGLPGLKGIIPDGINPDGSLRNIIYTLTKCCLLTTSNYTNTGMAFGIKNDNTLIHQERFLNQTTNPAKTYSFWYNPKDNYLYQSGSTTTFSKISGAICGKYDRTKGTITPTISNFSIKSVEGYTKPVYIDKIYKGSTLVYRGAYATNQTIFEKSTAGTYSVKLEKAGLYEITVVGGGGAAAMRGVYDDRGYGWSGGSGGAFVGTFNLDRGTYTVVVAKANNNTTKQTSNSQTSNPTDTGTYGSSVSGVVSVGGGGSGHYNSSYVGAAGAAATLSLTPITTTLNSAGKAGASGSGGKGSAAAKQVDGGASVYNGYGKGQGCKTSEYYSKRSWINGTAGFVKIVYKGSKV
jgi:hypothetical protein